MEKVFNIVSETLGTDYVVHSHTILHDILFTVLKKFTEEVFMVVKNDEEVSPVLASFSDVINWINTNA